MAGFRVCDLMGKIEKIRDCFQRIIDLMRYRAREATYGVQFLGLQEHLLSALAFGYIHTEHDYPRDSSICFAPGLINKVQVTHLRRLRVASHQLDRCTTPDK